MIKFEDHLGLVHHMVRRHDYRIRGTVNDYDDLFQVGCIGLLRAIERFDPNHGTKFSSYAATAITREIRTYLKIHGYRAVRYPEKILPAVKMIRANDLENHPVAEVAAFVGLSIKQTKLALACVQSKRSVPLDKQLDSEDDISYFIGREDDLSEADVRTFLNALPVKQREILELLMQGYKQKEIARMRGVSHQAIQHHMPRIKRFYKRWNKKWQLLSWK